MSLCLPAESSTLLSPPPRPPEAAAKAAAKGKIKSEHAPLPPRGSSCSEQGREATGPLEGMWPFEDGGGQGPPRKRQCRKATISVATLTGPTEVSVDTHAAVARESTNDRDSDAVFDTVVRFLCEDLAFEVHRAAKTQSIPMEELFAASSPSSAASSAAASSGGGSSSSGPATTETMARDSRTRVVIGDFQASTRESRFSVTCGNCGQKVGVTRYAPHLDKCMGKVRVCHSRGILLIFIVFSAHCLFRVEVDEMPPGSVPRGSSSR